MTPLKYAGGHLDRAGMQRRDAAWIEAATSHPDARAVVVWRDRVLVHAVDATPRAATPAFTDVAPHADPSSTHSFLGLDGDIPVFAVDLSHLHEDALGGIAQGATVSDASFVDLRRVGPVLALDDAALLGYARGILSWHRRARFCGTCGSPTESHEGGHMRRCTNADCAAVTYPRTDPAVIMLVEHGPDGGPPRCLLGHHRRLPPGVYSTLAGFVEPGESLEEAVAREVLEETGVQISSVRYVASQPWPFPASLMVGFRALATTDSVQVDPEELDEARWFTAEELATFGEWGDESAARRLPRRDSIARTLVDQWMADALGR